MAQTEKSVRCPACGAVTVLETRLDTVEYKGETATVRVKGHWCPKCSEAVLEAPALMKREQAFLALRAKVEGVLGPKDVAAIRERLRLSLRPW